MQAATSHDPASMDEVEEVKSTYLARAHGDIDAAFEMLALNAVAVVREYEGIVRRHVSHGYVRRTLPLHPGNGAT